MSSGSVHVRQTSWHGALKTRLRITDWPLCSISVIAIISSDLPVVEVFQFEFRCDPSALPKSCGSAPSTALPPEAFPPRGGSDVFAPHGLARSARRVQAP